ncbi:MAG: SH3 domain-containing protein [Propionicimonas sp.]|nr:SH3 domain-containing protein [Propionicimonas sp.]
MYEPRRVLGPIEADIAPTPHAEAFTKPRRAALTWRDHLGQRAGLGLVALAAVATSGAVILGGGPASAAVDLASAPATLERDAAPLSRSADRAVATLQVRPLSSSKLAEATEDLVALTPLFTTAELNVRAEASEDAELLGSVNAGTKVIATSTIEGKYRKVTAGKLDGWVLATSLADGAADEAAGITMAKCSRGSGVEAKLRADTIRIYRSVCALFPGVNSYGGWRAGGRQFHKNGRALDIMLTPGKESALGWRIAKYLIANAKAFNIDHVIFEQKIWTPGTPHWRGMADRGGTTANHYDHVHVAIRG